MSWLIALFSRIALLCVWIWTPLVGRAFHGAWLLPLLGLILLPITTLVYVLVYTSSANGVTGWGWLWVALGLLIDLAAHSYPARHSMQARRNKAAMPSRSENA